MTTTSSLARRSTLAAASLLIAAAPLRAQAAPDSLAHIRSAPAAIRALLDAHIFNPRALEAPAVAAALRTVDSLAGVAASRREFFAGFNRVWAGGPISHINLARAQMPASAMMAFVDTMRFGDAGTSLRWEGRIAILDVKTMMGVDTRERITKAYETIVAQGAEGLVIDLRENEGGAFAVVPLIGHLIKQPVEGGVFLGRKWNATHSGVPTTREIKAITPWTGYSLTRFWGDVESEGILRIQFTPMAPHYAGPVMVLTSKKTASAAEMATDAMLNSRRVTVVGEQTAGEMLSQRMFDLFPGTHLFVPIADYYSARMGRIEGVGVAPTLAVPPAAALDSALARLRKR